MNERYKRVYFIDTENQGAMYLKDLNKLETTDLVLCMFTDYSPKFTYEQVGQFLEAKSSFKFINCLAGTPNALDFQISSMLGYYLRQSEEGTKEGEKSDTEFIILSQDTGYYGIVQFWQNQGYHVNIKTSLFGDNVDVKKALENITNKKIHVAMEVAAEKAKLSGTENRATHKLEQEQKLLEKRLEAENLKNNVKNAQSAVEKFNSRLEKSKELKKVKNNKSEKPGKSEKSVKSEKPEKEVISIVKEVLESKGDLEEALKEKLNEKFLILNHSSTGIVYNNIKNLPLSEIAWYGITENADKCVKFIRCSSIHALVLGYILYYSRTKEEMKEMLIKHTSGDSKQLYVNTLMKRYEQKHFNNYYGID